MLKNLSVDENIISSTQMLAALRWQLEMGADEAVAEHPRTLEAAEIIVPAAELVNIKPAKNAPQKLIAPVVDVSLNDNIAQARTAADAASNMAELNAAIMAFNGCGLKKTAMKTVLGDGADKADLLIIGDAPSADDDRSGTPFSGDAGQLLDLALGYLGKSRQQNVFLSNCLYWRPPGNRQPSAEEIAICLPFMQKMIALLQPKIIMALGGVACQALLNEKRSITRVRGQVFSYQNQYLSAPITLHASLHPSFLLRQPAARKDFWADLLAATSITN